MSHHCCDPCRATGCRAQSVTTKTPQFPRCRGSVALPPPPHPPKERPHRTYLATHYQKCRGSISRQKGITITRGVATTLSRVALNCDCATISPEERKGSIFICLFCESKAMKTTHRVRFSVFLCREPPLFLQREQWQKTNNSLQMQEIQQARRDNQGKVANRLKTQG